MAKLSIEDRQEILKSLKVPIQQRIIPVDWTRCSTQTFYEIISQHVKLLFTEEEKNILREIEDRSSFTEEEATKFPGLHFCLDWDNMLICKRNWEFGCCGCKLE